MSTIIHNDLAFHSAESNRYLVPFGFISSSLIFCPSSFQERFLFAEPDLKIKTFF